MRRFWLSVLVAVLWALSALPVAADEYHDPKGGTYAYVLCRWKTDHGYVYGRAGAGTLDRRLQDDPGQLRWSIETCRQWMTEDRGSGLKIWIHNPGDSDTIHWQRP